MPRLIPLFLFYALTVLSRTSIADSSVPSASDVHAYAIVVGNNAPGPGQSPLHYAEQDARRFLSVLSELGGYKLQSSELLLSPSPIQLWGAFATIDKRIADDTKAGRESVFFFYYSGHARSSAIDLGPHRVALANLRARIEAMPASLRVVLLDACQSGAISHVKGAKPASDFSINSINGLRMTGMAIMASSSAVELSQESDSLQGSYFTHHLVAGLRGGADENHDGLVTLAEVYDYAYNNTLLTTAVSAVGKQHVTLETDLRGKGDVALTRPGEARAKLRLPKRIGAAYTISKNKNVIAEVSKPVGESTLISLPAGAYKILVRTSRKVAKRCSVQLVDQQIATVDWPTCTRVAIDDGTNKGAPGEVYIAHGPQRSLGPLWSFEVSLMLRSSTTDAYTDRLETFGYVRSEGLFDLHAHLGAHALRRMGPHLQLGGSFGRLETEKYRRHTDGASTYEMRWSTYHLSGLARLYQDWVLGSGHAQVFAEASLGLSRAASTLREEETERVVPETQYGYSVIGSLGAILMPRPYLGLVVSLGFGASPTLSNALGETRSDATMRGSIGVRTSF